MREREKFNVYSLINILKDEGKMAFQISLHSHSSDIFQSYENEGILVPGDYEVALKSFVTYNNIPNISKELSNNTLLLLNPGEINNNEIIETSNSNSDNYNVIVLDESSFYFSYRKNQSFSLKHEERIITFETGTFSLQDISSVIQSDGEHYKHGTIMLIDMVRMRIGIKSTWTLDMRPTNSICSLIGFERKTYPSTGDFIWSTNPVRLFSVQNIRVKSNLTHCNIQDDKTRDSTLYEFPLSVLPAEKIIERPIDPEYYKVVMKDFINI